MSVLEQWRAGFHVAIGHCYVNPYCIYQKILKIIETSKLRVEALRISCFVVDMSQLGYLLYRSGVKLLLTAKWTGSQIGQSREKS